jgi:hypothetical protein
LIERQWPQLAASLAFEPWLRSLRVERVVAPPKGERGGTAGFIGLPPDASFSDEAVAALATEALCWLARSVIIDHAVSQASGDAGELRALSRRYWVEGIQTWSAVSPDDGPSLPDCLTVSGRLQLALLANRRLEGEVDDWQFPAVGPASTEAPVRRSVAR